MSNVQEFAEFLWNAVQQTEPPVMCSRVEFVVEESGVMLLLRMNPQLSEAFFGVEHLQFPLPLLVNTTLMYQCALPYIQAGKAAVTITELMRAAELGVMNGNLHGTYPDQASGVFHTPSTDYAPDDPQAFEWAKAWRNALVHGYMEEEKKSAKSARLLVVHVPDQPLETFTDEEWSRIAVMNVGWNCDNMDGRTFSARLPHRIWTAAPYAHVVRHCM